MKDIIIRAGTNEDVEKISQLWLDMVNEANLGHNPNVQWWRTMCNNLLAMKGLYFLVVAEVKGEMVGFVDAIIYPEPQDGKIHGMGQSFFVIPEYRKTAISSKLYKHIFKIGRQMNVQVVNFLCSDYNFWTKKGYVEKRALLRRELCLL